MKIAETIKKYTNVYTFKISQEEAKKNILDFKNFIIPTKKKKEDISDNVDKIIFSIYEKTKSKQFITSKILKFRNFSNRKWKS